MKLQMQCPAKINLFLEITGKRPDGYHRLATLFAKINLYDVIDLETGPGSRGRIAFEVESSDPAVTAADDNLVLRAARAFYKSFRIGQDVRIKLTKRIPVGAGLGGGSSDAAGTLIGLARLFEIKLDTAKRKTLHRLGVALGADVPFFLHPSSFCLGTGIGDRLKAVSFPVSLPYMILIYPGVHVSTVASYKALPKPDRKDVLTRLSHLDKLLGSLKKGRPVEEWGPFLFNRLETAQLPELARVAQAQAILNRSGARGVRMSGSGSSVFGFVGSHAEGEKCLQRLQGYPWKVFLTSCQG